MTFLVARKKNNVVYLCADSAVTGSVRSELSGKSTFGELDKESGTLSVQEAAFKLSTFGNVVLAVAGYVDPAMSFIRTFKEDCKNSEDSYASFKRAVNSHTPLNSDSSFKIILVITEFAGPRLLTFNLRNDEKIEEHGDSLLWTGSLPHQFTDKICKQLDMLYRSDIENPKNILVTALAILQNVGIHDYVLKHGVGGIFSGVYVDSNAIHWQSRVAYAVLNNKDNMGLVMTGMFDKALAVSTTLGNLNKIFSSDITISVEELKRTNILSNIKSGFNSGKFDFIVLLSVQHKCIVILEMKQNISSKSGKMNVIKGKDRSNGETQQILEITDKVLDFVLGKNKLEANRFVDTYVYFFDYQPNEYFI